MKKLLLNLSLSTTLMATILPSTFAHGSEALFDPTAIDQTTYHMNLENIVPTDTFRTTHQNILSKLKKDILHSVSNVEFSYFSNKYEFYNGKFNKTIKNKNPGHSSEGLEVDVKRWEAKATPNLDKCIDFFEMRRDLTLLKKAINRYSAKHIELLRKEELGDALNGLHLRIMNQIFLSDIKEACKFTLPITKEFSIKGKFDFAYLKAAVLSKDDTKKDEELNAAIKKNPLTPKMFNKMHESILLKNEDLEKKINKLKVASKKPETERNLVEEFQEAGFILTTIMFQKSLVNADAFTTSYNNTKKELLDAQTTFAKSGVFKKTERYLLVKDLIPDNLLPKNEEKKKKSNDFMTSTIHAE